MSRTEIVKPGDFVKVAPTHPSRHAGRAGLLVEVDREVARVRFSAKRVYEFQVADLRRVVRGVR